MCRNAYWVHIDCVLFIVLTVTLIWSVIRWSLIFFTPNKYVNAKPTHGLVHSFLGKYPEAGFVQEKCFASHTCFGRHMDVNC